MDTIQRKLERAANEIDPGDKLYEIGDIKGWVGGRLKGVKGRYRAPGKN